MTTAFDLRPGSTVMVRAPFEIEPVAVRVTAVNNERACGYTSAGFAVVFPHSDVVAT